MIDLPERPAANVGVLRSIVAIRRTIFGGALVAAASCGGDAPVSPSPATLTGVVSLQDAWANRMDDFSGIDVAVDGVATHDTTDATGAWRIDGVPSGTHNITFSKPTFGTMRVLRQAVTTPSTTVPDVTMTQAPWQQAVIDSVRLATQAGREVYLIDGHLAAPPPSNAKLSGTIAFFGRNDSVSADVTSFAIWANGVDRTGRSSLFSISLPASVVRTAFPPGTQAFVTVYATSAICGCYTDPRTQRPVLTAVGPRANVVAVTIQ